MILENRFFRNDNVDDIQTLARWLFRIHKCDNPFYTSTTLFATEIPLGTLSKLCFVGTYSGT